MKSAAKFVFIIGLLLSLFSASSYASPKLDSVALSDSKIQSQQNLQLEIKLSWQKDEKTYTFRFPQLNVINLIPIRQGEAQETFIQDGREFVQKTITFELKADQPGKATIHAFEISYSEHEDNPELLSSETFFIPEQKISVTGTPFHETQTFKTILIAVTALGVLLTAVLIFFKKKREKDNAPKPLTRQEKSLQRIQDITRQIQKPQIDLLHELSIELRDFIADYYEVSGTRLTESELLLKLENKGQSKEELQYLKKLFDSLEQIKYTGSRLSQEEFNYLQKKVVEFVESKKVVG